MSNRLLPLSILALAAAITWHGMPHAQADAPAASRGASCATFVVPARQMAWMNEQMAQGRRNFIGIGDARLCAW